MAKTQKEMQDVEPKRVVYLIGAGASHAELISEGEPHGLVMSEVIRGILKETVRQLEENKEGRLELKMPDKKALESIRKILSSIPDNKIDVEQLITLCEYSELQEQVMIANNLRKLFRNVILDRIQQAGIEKPRLMSALIDMHSIAELEERLCGILTLNYDNFIEKALLANSKQARFCVDMSTLVDKLMSNSDSSVTLLKLHGSFDWKRGLPISVDDNIPDEKDVLWIPPGVAKNHERYPFNIIWGKATELLCCDILRVIGCSLNRNDWGLVTLLYTSIISRLTGNRSFSIELINYLDDGKKMKNDYAYLDMMKLIVELPVIRHHFQQQYMQMASGSTQDYEHAYEEFFGNPELNPELNVFDYWLRAQGNYLEELGSTLHTDSNIFRNYINNKPMS